ncbi:hypothetical protein DBR42_15325, partial [Pelomonas sp. HMWF004]
YEVKRSWFNKRVTDITKTSLEETANPSDISGRSVSLGAGGNLNIVGSLVMADGAVGLHADQDLNLLATQEASYAYESRFVKKSGIFGNGGLSITIGSKSRTDITSTQETRQASTSVGSLAGDVLATAGGSYLQLSSDITAPMGDIHVAAQNITLQSNNNTRSVLNIVRERQSGITLSASNPLVSAAQTAVEMAKTAKRTENGRYQAMALLTSGLTIYNQYHDLTEGSKQLTSATADMATKGWSISVGLGTSQSNYESLTTSTTPIESSLNAGRNLSLTATSSGADSGDINLIGSRVIASENLTLRASRDITMTAAVGKDTEKTKRTSSAASVGISFGVGGSTQGFSVNLAASRSNAWSNGWGTTFYNSELTAGQLLSVDSGRDWSLSGARATGQTVSARVGSSGSGNLSIVSPQDESFYQAKEQSYGINVSIPIPGAGIGAPSLGLSASQLKLLAENESVKQQSSIVAGTGGFDVRVNGHTHLKGSAVASKGASNYFETQTLTHEDVVSRDVATGSSWSVSLNISTGSSATGAVAGSSVGYARLNTSETFTTKSSIAGGVTLTRPDLQASNVAAIKAKERDPLVSLRNQRQSDLQELLWNEPPPCDGCSYNSLPTTPAADAATATSAGSAKAGQMASTTASRTAAAGGSEADLYGGNSQWRAWQAAVQALEAEIAQLDGRINAIDAKVYQDRSSLSNSPNGLHQPLLHTFDKAKATQELRDGVAVTAAFGKAAYKAAGDKAGEYEKQAKADCSNGSASACKDAERWGEGGLYRGALHAAIGGIAFGTPGATGNIAGTLALNAMDQVIQSLNITDLTAINLLKNLAVTVAGAGVGGTAGAAAAFNADANNRQLHPKEIDWIKRNRSLFARQQGISDDLAEKRLADQAFRQVQFGASGEEDFAARTFLTNYSPRVNLPGDPFVPGMNTGYWFSATQEQKINSAVYLNAVLNSPTAINFYRINSITQPTVEQIANAATTDFAARDLIKRQTIGAAMAAGGLLLTPAMSGLAIEVAEFSRLGPVTYCLAKPNSCTVAAEAIACGAAGAACPVGSLVPQIQASTRLAREALAKDPIIGSAAERIYLNSKALDEVLPELKGVNPHYVPDAGVGVNTNCVSCVIAADQRISGANTAAVAGPSGGYKSQNDLLPAIPFGFQNEILTPAQVEAQMLAAGSGSRGVVLIKQAGGVDHVINVVNRAGVVYFVDTQIGRIVTIQPNVVLKLGRPG